MNTVHLVIPGLLLPNEVAREARAGLFLPALLRLLRRGHAEVLEPMSLEQLMCECFGLTPSMDVPIAPISAVFDGLGTGCWLRADPVHLDLQRTRLLLSRANVGTTEAAEMCRALNIHYRGQGIEFLAPHPERWYVRLQSAPRMRTTPISQAIGTDVLGALPSGEDAAQWHQIANDAQMLLFAMSQNATREARGELTVNSVWFWGGGCNKDVSLARNYDRVQSDGELASMFAAVSGIPYLDWQTQWSAAAGAGRQLLVWTGLANALERDDAGGWRVALQDFETAYARPIFEDLRAGRIGQLQLDLLAKQGIRRIRLSRADAWAFWRRGGSLTEWPLV